GPRNVLIGVEVVQGAATAGYLVVHGWWGFLAVSVLVALTQQAAPPLIQALVAELAGAERRTRILAVHRTGSKIGISAGNLTAGGRGCCSDRACPTGPSYCSSRTRWPLPGRRRCCALSPAAGARAPGPPRPAGRRCATPASSH